MIIWMCFNRSWPLFSPKMNLLNDVFEKITQVQWHQRSWSSPVLTARQTFTSSWTSGQPGEVAASLPWIVSLGGALVSHWFPRQNLGTATCFASLQHVHDNLWFVYLWLTRLVFAKAQLTILHAACKRWKSFSRKYQINQPQLDGRWQQAKARQTTDLMLKLWRKLGERWLKFIGSSKFMAKVAYFPWFLMVFCLAPCRGWQLFEMFYILGFHAQRVLCVVRRAGEVQAAVLVAYHAEPAGHG